MDKKSDLHTGLNGHNGEVKTESLEKACSGTSDQKCLTTLDTDESKLTQEALEEATVRLEQANNLLSGIIETNNDLIAAIDTDFRYLALNQAYRREYQAIYGVDIHVGDNMIEMLASYPEDQRNVYEVFLPAFQGESVISTQIYGDPSKSRRIYELHVSPIRNSQGCIIGAAHINTEITQRKQMEEENIKTIKKVSEILNSIQDHFYVIDYDWNFIHANERLISKLNKKSEDIVGKNLWDVVPMHFGTHFEENLRAAMEKREIRRFELAGQYTDDWYSVAVFPSAEGITCLGREITQQKKADKKALKLVKELEEADRNKNHYISVLSHELRNPLASITASLDLIERASEDDGKQIAKAIETAKRQCKQLTNLVDDLLDITRITQNRIVLKKEKLELNELINKAAQDYRLNFFDDNVKLKVELTSPIYIEADSSRITQVIGNLLHNAAKFTQNDDLVTVTVSHETDSEEAVITVQDTGRGIEPFILQNLFKPFMEADIILDRSQGGLGLGLAIVKGMVELHSGRVEAFSEGLGKGAKFTIRLPLPKENVGTKECSGKSEAKITGVLKILIIDDNVDLAVVMCELIRFLGHEAEAAYNGADGVAKARELRPDVIICDIGLPDMSGYEVANVIRKDPELKGIFLIAFSGYAQPEDMDNSNEAGFDRHLGKPVSLETLQMVLSDAR